MMKALIVKLPALRPCVVCDDRGCEFCPAVKHSTKKE